MMTVGADRGVRGGMAAGGFIMSVLQVVAVVANPAPPMSSGRTPLMRHTDSTDAAVAADALPGAVDAGDVCAPEFQNADETEVTTDCRRCWYCCVTDIESAAEEGA